MIVNFQKPIDFINDCKWIGDYKELEKAIKWFSSKPVAGCKHIYIHGRYPAISIYDQKIHVHRLLGMYRMKRELEVDEYVHHKNGNRLDCEGDNLEIMWASEHQSMTNKGRKHTQEHNQKIGEANKKRKGMKYKIYENPELQGECMTKEQFDNYRFTVNTQVNYFQDIWDKVTEVYFDKRWVGIERGQIIKYQKIKGIKD